MVRFSKKFTTHLVEINNVSLFFRHAGSKNAPLVFLIHGYTQTSDMWAPLANILLDDNYQVIAIDMHGLGQSGFAKGRYDKKSIAFDFHELIVGLGYQNLPVHIIGHDLGAFAAYAYAAQFAKPQDTLIMMDATVPGIGIWPLLLQQARTWHFGFYGIHAERLVHGRERIYLDRFWDEFAAKPSVFSEEMREFYTEFFCRTDGLSNAFSHFQAFEQDTKDNLAFAVHKLSLPVLGLGGEYSLGPALAENIAHIAENNRIAIIKNAGHWLLEENPEQTIAETRNFLAKYRVY